MAVSPKTMKAQMETDLDILEKEIDAVLKNSKIYGNRVNIIPPKQMSYGDFQILRNRYIAAGWNEVAWNDSQHDGPHMSFSY